MNALEHIGPILARVFAKIEAATDAGEEDGPSQKAEVDFRISPSEKSTRVENLAGEKKRRAG